MEQRDDKTVEKTIHTAFLICAAIGIMIGVFCILFAHPIFAGTAYKKRSDRCGGSVSEDLRAGYARHGCLQLR